MSHDERIARWKHLAELHARGAVPPESAHAGNGVNGLIADLAARAADHLASLDCAARDAFLVRLVDAVDSAVEQRTPQPRPLTPEEKEWLSGLWSEEEILDGLKDLEKNGGQQLHEFLPTLLAAVGSDE